MNYDASSSGYVDFTTGVPMDYSNVSDGIAVYIAVRNKSHSDNDSSRWDKCALPRVAIIDDTLLLSDQNTYDEYYGNSIRLNEHGRRKLSATCLCLLCIGTIDTILQDTEDCPWTCTYHDLTPKGAALYDAIQELYGDEYTVDILTWYSE